MSDSPQEPRAWPRRVVAGSIALVVALVALLVMSFLPTEYVLQRPGPVYNTIGAVQDADGAEVPLISVPDGEAHETTGSLSLTTVEVVGNREHPLSWIELASAWFDRSRAIVPISAVFPEGQTSEQRDAQNQAAMTDSQSEAEAAALRHLGYDVPADIRVVSLTDDSPSQGLIEEGDLIRAVDGQTVEQVTGLRDGIAAAAGDPVVLTLERDGDEVTEEVTPEKLEDDSWAIGALLSVSYENPVDISIQLDNVGGPSAGTMFALGIIDTLTEGEMTGGENIAGTGTITAEGDIGAIGGIRQKLYGASNAGNDFFLAPASNCAEVVGHVPDRLTVVSVETLDDAVDAVDMIAQGEAENLPSCAPS
ncbi:YlbL family protein [Microbacterium gubbeenense]|uniref:YlbL family protein n=1 Tax=Microbacterium gubbeenense TaxID=159896 RepID=UPI003F9A2895